MYIYIHVHTAVYLYISEPNPVNMSVWLTNSVQPQVVCTVIVYTTTTCQTITKLTTLHRMNISTTYMYVRVCSQHVQPEKYMLSYFGNLLFYLFCVQR